MAIIEKRLEHLSGAPRQLPGGGFVPKWFHAGSHIYNRLKALLGYAPTDSRNASFPLIAP